jgi:molybdopterin converting factor small subunit
MVIINLMYFGSVMDATGKPAEKVESPETISELNENLHTRYPGLAAISYRYSVNRKLVTENQQLFNGDEIALLPPFAGG